MTNIKTTTWEPDTCDCVIQYKWDEDLDEDTRTNSLNFIGKACQAHSNLLPNEAVTYTAVLDENNKKGRALLEALQTAPNQLANVITNPDGTFSYILKENIIFNFSFSGTSPNRILTIRFIGISLTNQQRNTIQNKLNSIFGSGNVVINQ